MHCGSFCQFKRGTARAVLQHGTKVHVYEDSPEIRGNIVKELKEGIPQAPLTAPKKASEWLPLVHIMIGNMKTFINGTFHGVSSEHLQEYLDEVCYRFNRWFQEPELPLRLLNACLAHFPVKMAEVP